MKHLRLWEFLQTHLGQKRRNKTRLFKNKVQKRNSLDLFTHLLLHSSLQRRAMETFHNGPGSVSFPWWVLLCPITTLLLYSQCRVCDFDPAYTVLMYVCIYLRKITFYFSFILFGSCIRYLIQYLIILSSKYTYRLYSIVVAFVKENIFFLLFFHILLLLLNRRISTHSSEKRTFSIF